MGSAETSAAQTDKAFENAVALGHGGDLELGTTTDMKLDATWGQLAQYDHLLKNGFGMCGAVLGDTWFTPSGTSADTAVNALRGLLERHEALRTVFEESHGVPRAGQHPVHERILHQIVLDHPGSPAPDLVECTADELVEACRLIQEKALSMVFDPADRSPLKTTLIMSAGGVRAVVVHVPHMVADYYGLLTLKQEFYALLSRSPLPTGAPIPRARQPREQVAFEKQTRIQRKADQARRYFQDVLANAPDVFLSTRRPRTELRASAAERLSTVVAESALALSRAHRVSVPSVLLGAVMLLLAAHGDSDRVIIRSLFARRNWKPNESYVAPQNLAALIACGIQTDEPFTHFLRAVRLSALRGYAHTDYDPHDLLREEEQAGQEHGITVDGFCLFNFMGSDDPAVIQEGSLAEVDQYAPEQPGTDPTIYTSDGVTIPLDMQFIVAFAAGFVPGAISVNVTSNDAFLGAPASRFIDGVERLLTHALAHPAATSAEVVRAAGLG